MLRGLGWTLCSCQEGAGKQAITEAEQLPGFPPPGFSVTFHATPLQRPEPWGGGPRPRPPPPHSPLLLIGAAPPRGPRLHMFLRCSHRGQQATGLKLKWLSAMILDTCHFSLCPSAGWHPVRERPSLMNLGTCSGRVQKPLDLLLGRT